MVMRTTWKGSVQFAMVNIPIRIFNAASPEDGIKFNQLHKGCLGNVGVQSFCKKCNAKLATEDIVRGYEYAPSLYVVIQDEDFDSIKLKSTKVIDVQGFVKASEVHPSLYETPYFLGPDGKVAPQAYAVFRDAMRESGKVAIGKVVMRNREETVLLSPEDHGILLYKLRSPYQLRTVEQIPGLETTTDADPQQVLLARSLIDALTVPLTSIDLTDHYQEAVKVMIDKKVNGEEMVSVPEQAYPVIDLENALALSLAQVRDTPLQLEAPLEPLTTVAQEAQALQPPVEQKKTRRHREMTKISKQPTSTARSDEEDDQPKT